MFNAGNNGALNTQMFHKKNKKYLNYEKIYYFIM